MTSHDVVARARKILGERRVGHTGTLDPFATGVLVLVVGGATRIAQFLSGAEKEYEAVIRLGYSTSTGDVTGERIDAASHAKALSLSKEEVESAITSLCGEIKQVPPMYSAKKIAGRKLYEHARRGEEVARKPVRVMIHEFDLLTPLEPLLANDDGSNDIQVRVVCSAGTYIRTLAEDLGKELGVDGAHLIELRRTRAGRFRLEAALTLEKLAEAFTQNRLIEALISPHNALSHLPAIDLDDEQLRKTLHGVELSLSENEQQLSHGDSIRLSRSNELIAVGKFDSERMVIHPSVVFGSP